MLKHIGLIKYRDADRVMITPKKNPYPFGRLSPMSAKRRRSINVINKNTSETNVDSGENKCRNVEIVANTHRCLPKPLETGKMVHILYNYRKHDKNA